MAVIASVVLATRWLDRRAVERVDGRWWRLLAIGFGAGALLMTLIFGVEHAAGWIDVTGFVVSTDARVPLWLAFLFSAVKAACVGTYEEFVSRGYLLRNLAEGTGSTTAAVVLSSLVFAVLHGATDNASVLSTIGLFVNGLAFAAAALCTGRLSAAIGLHVAWNLFEGSVFGFPVSGDKEGASLIGIRQLGNDVVTGGAYGPEAGVVGIVASLVGVALFYFPFIFARSRSSRSRMNVETIR